MTTTDLRCLSVREMVRHGLAGHSGLVHRATAKGPPRQGEAPWWRKRVWREEIVLNQVEPGALTRAGFEP